MPLSGAVVKRFPAKIVSRLLSWKRVTYSDLEVLPHAKRLIEGGFVSRNDMLFCAMLERGSGKSLPVLLRFLRMRWVISPVVHIRSITRLQISGTNSHVSVSSFKASFENLFFSPIALIYDCVCVVCVETLSMYMYI